MRPPVANLSEVIVPLNSTSALTFTFSTVVLIIAPASIPAEPAPVAEMDILPLMVRFLTVAPSSIPKKPTAASFPTVVVRLKLEMVCPPPLNLPLNAEPV